MPVHVVGAIRVVGEARWQRYLERVGGTFAPYGGTVLLRGERLEDFRGRAHGERIVVIEFPDLAAARRWHASPEYQALVGLRDAGADVILTVYGPAGQP